MATYYDPSSVVLTINGQRVTGFDPAHSEVVLAVAEHERKLHSQLDALADQTFVANGVAHFTVRGKELFRKIALKESRYRKRLLRRCQRGKKYDRIRAAIELECYDFLTENIGRETERGL